MVQLLYTTHVARPAPIYPRWDLSASTPWYICTAEGYSNHGWEADESGRELEKRKGPLILNLPRSALGDGVFTDTRHIPPKVKVFYAHRLLLPDPKFIIDSAPVDIAQLTSYHTVLPGDFRPG